MELLIGMGDWSSKKCALNWKMKGMKSFRLYFQLVPLVRHTEETEFGLLPTPCVADIEGSPKRIDQISLQNGRFIRTSDTTNIQFGAKLNDVARLLPTPRVKGHGNSHQRIRDGKIDDLTTMMKFGMLPTPNSFDWNTEQEPSKYQQRKEIQMKKGVNLHYQLRQMAVHLNPTGTTSQLNPRFVAEMMGFPPNWTELPFQNGETKA